MLLHGCFPGVMMNSSLLGFMQVWHILGHLCIWVNLAVTRAERNMVGWQRKCSENEGKDLVTAYFHGNKYRYENRFYLLLGIFCCQWLFLEKSEYWHI